jgi:steroid delta-isomerase-like uncharacterized protein
MTTSASHSPAEAKAIVRRFFDELINTGDVSAAPRVLSPDHVAHFAGFPQAMDLAGLIEASRNYFGSFPDLHVTIQDLLAEGDRVAVRWTWTGTHRGPFMGVPATGRHVDGAGMGLYRLAGDRIAEQWVTEDMTTLMQQLSQSQAVEP